MIGLSAVVLMIAFRRWRHLLVFLYRLFLLQLAIWSLPASVLDRAGCHPLCRSGEQ